MDISSLITSLAAAIFSQPLTLRPATRACGHRALAAAVLLLGMAGARPSLAQDLIVRTDGTRIEARVLDVNGPQITYKNWAGQDGGPITLLSTDYVRYVQYQDGTRRDFTVAMLPPKGPPEAEPAPNLGRNIVAIRPLDAWLTCLTLTYERLLGPDRRVGVKVPLTVKLHRQPAETRHGWGYYPANKIFSTGLEVDFYSGPPARFRYFFGPVVQYGQCRYRSGQEYLGNFDFFGLDFGPVYTYQEGVGEHFAVLFNNGVYYQMGKRFVFAADAGIGWQTKVLDKGLRNLNTEELAGSQLKITANINFGYQF